MMCARLLCGCCCCRPAVGVKVERPTGRTTFDTGEDRRKIGPASEPRVLAQPTGVTFLCVLTGQLSARGAPSLT